jgi:hypothetical protein
MSMSMCFADGPRDDQRDISSRELTAASVIWHVPLQEAHRIVRTPNLAPLLDQLQLLEGWSETSAVTLVLTPMDGLGVRKFKIADKRTGANLVIVDDVMHIIMSVACLLILKQFRAGLSIPTWQRITCRSEKEHNEMQNDIQTAWNVLKAVRALEGARFGCPVDHREHPNCKTMALQKLQADVLAGTDGSRAE